MTLSDCFYRIGAWCRHRLTARNTLGHGVHSPFLYYIVRMLIYDKNAYYCFARIEQRRRELLLDRRRIMLHDFGTGHSGERRISDIAATSLSDRSSAQLLFKLVNFLQPETIVELGTSLGVTAAYLASPSAQARVVTFEGSETVTAVAEETFRRLGLQRVEVVTGYIDTTLPVFLQGCQQVDFAFIDANHTEDATVRYFELLLPKCHERSVLVLDDIHYSAGMGRAWQRIKQHDAVTATFDLYGMGIVFFDKQLLRKHYVLKV